MTQKLYEILEKKLTVFANQMLQAYENRNILKEFCTIKSFNDQDRKFFQIAKRTGLPKDFFDERDNVDNSMIASDFVRAIVTGERDFILKAILDSKEISRQEANSFDYKDFVKILSKMENPTHIFIPIKLYFKPLNKWIFSNREQIKFVPGKQAIILVGEKEIQTHWVTSDLGINDIIVVDKNKLKVIQKTFEQSNIPKEIKPISEFDHYSNNKTLMLYFSERDADNFDFVFRSIISKPELTKESAIIINVKNKPEEE